MRTELCDAAEWNRRYRDIQRRQDSIEADRRRAMESMARMIVVPGVDVGEGEDGIRKTEAEIDGSPVVEIGNWASTRSIREIV